jgi:hypothetical protein
VWGQAVEDAAVGGLQVADTLRLLVDEQGLRLRDLLRIIGALHYFRHCKHTQYCFQLHPRRPYSSNPS